MLLTKSLEKCFNIEQLHQLAHKNLPLPVYDYMAGGADDEVSLSHNVNAFDQYQIIPKCLTNVTDINTRCHLLGCDMSAPLFISPVGQQRMFNADADIAGAKAADKQDIIFTLSTFSSKTIEEVASSSYGNKMFQVYVVTDQQLNEEIMQRAKAAKYQAMCLTVDTVVGGNRERDIKNGLTIPMNLSLKSMFEFAKHPLWVKNYFMSGGKDLVNLNKAPSSGDTESFLKYMGNLLERNLTWDHAAKMIKQWGGPFAIKGIMSVDDAVKAKHIGASAIMISNHGGRQLDCTPAPIEMVADIRAAVGPDIEIIVDGGIRRGSDIFKAIALGANAVSLGRAYAYGLAAGGQAGAEKAISILKTELVRTMALAGCQSLKDINTSMIRKR
ncbi:alpha-hydroxy acid oxidase [Shewanella sp. UCD-KL21]|uniref:alpha-hydroxy acid oxidase n=1 Tax=Shewanella sp. UCD-KL21 TaxID=1917164 RepID=UPI0009709234|nr:alpha-hydroxy acid oxidase [Shewanella sp. UCD-KL21]